LARTAIFKLVSLEIVCDERKGNKDLIAKGDIEVFDDDNLLQAIRENVNQVSTASK